MKEPRPWVLKRSLQGGRDGMEIVHQIERLSETNDQTKKMSVNTQPAKRRGVLGLINLFPRNIDHDKMIILSTKQSQVKSLYQWRISSTKSWEKKVMIWKKR